MQRKLRLCFERGISTTLTSEETGISKKTVHKFFDEWTEQIIELETGDFLERQKKEHQRIILSFDYDILEAYKFFDEINLEINNLRKQSKQVPRHLFSFKLELMRFIGIIKEKKGAISMIPTIESLIDKKVDERITKLVQDRERN